MDEKQQKKYKEIIERYKGIIPMDVHTQPSPQTLERLTALETNQENMMEIFKDLKEQNSTEHNEIKQMFKEFGDKVEKALEKKADKEDLKRLRGKVDKILTWAAMLIGGGVVVIYIITQTGFLNKLFKII